MSSVVVDTHAFVWYLLRSPRECRVLDYAASVSSETRIPGDP